MVVCVTGKIGTGKSTVARMISSILKAKIIDVDRVGHEVLEMEDVVKKIKEIFGGRAVKNGRVDREYLRSVVFKDRELLKKLEEVVHPIMRDIVTKRARSEARVVIDCALLERMKLKDICDLILTVVAPYEVARKRKSHLDEETFKAIWESQKDVRALGDVLENSEDDMKALEEKVKSFLRRASEHHQL